MYCWCSMNNMQCYSTQKELNTLLKRDIKRRVLLTFILNNYFDWQNNSTQQKYKCAVMLKFVQLFLLVLKILLTNWFLLWLAPALYVARINSIYWYSKNDHLLVVLYFIFAVVLVSNWTALWRLSYMRG
jgi:hypothetical protein